MKNRIGFRKIFILSAAVAFFGSIFLTNYLITNEADISVMLRKSIRIPFKGKFPVFYNLKGAQQKEIVRKEHLDPNRQFSRSVILINDKEVARYKSKGEHIYELSGNIPFGKVQFFNLTAKTYGTEFFRSGLRHGDYFEYYETGELKRESQYAKGRKMLNKEYFIDGTLRMEEDYYDALVLSEHPEVGKGKVYYRSGILRYEWSLTNRDRGGYTKAFNIDGSLMQARYFDRNGKEKQ